MASKKKAKLEKVVTKKKRRATKEVVARTMGFYDNQRRRPGDVFRIPEDEKLGSWMVLKSEYEGDEGEESDDDGEDAGGASSGNKDVI